MFTSVTFERGPFSQWEVNGSGACVWSLPPLGLLHSPPLLASLLGLLCTDLLESAMLQAVSTSLPQMGDISLTPHHMLPASLSTLVFPNILSSSLLNLPSGFYTVH